jgi:hypothetical protein
MIVLEILGDLFAFLGANKSEQKIKPPKILFLFHFLTVLASIWAAIEIKPIASLQSPLLFLSFFALVGFLISLLIMYLLWRLNWIDFFTITFAVYIAIPVMLLTICAASAINFGENAKGNLGFPYKIHPNK